MCVMDDARRVIQRSIDRACGVIGQRLAGDEPCVTRGGLPGKWATAQAADDGRHLTATLATLSLTVVC
jgi:hypothetical protein